jgi:hypothetical protein
MCAAVRSQRPRGRERHREPRRMAERLLLLGGRLADLDRAILRLMHEHRVFTTGQLAQAFFDSHDRAEHRLRQLTDAKVLACFRPHTRHGEGSAGAAVLAAEQASTVRRLGYRTDKALELAHSQRLAQTVGINGFFTALLGHAHRQRPARARLTAWLSERACHDLWGHVVRADGYGRWQEADREVDFFLEYDRGTEPLERPPAKLAGYQELAAATQIPTHVLFWPPSARREASIRQALADEGRWGRVRFLVATASPTLRFGPAEAAWLLLGQTWPRRRLIKLDDIDVDAWTPISAGPTR